MRITLLLLFSFVVISTCSAQITKGTVFVGGSGYYDKQSSKNNQSSNISYVSSSSNFNFNPKVGYFIADNIAVGLGINFSRFRSKSEVNGIEEAEAYKDNSFGINPFGRYYKMLGERAGFFGQLTVSFTSGKNETGDFTNRKYTSIGAGVAPGFIFFATPKIGIETTIGNLGYFHFKNKYYGQDQNNPIENNTNEFVTSVNASNIFLGLNFYLGR